MWSNTDAGNRGLFSKQSVLDQVTIGAQKTKDGQVYKGFQGEISHVIITSETLTDADAIAISKPETSGEIASGSAVGEMFQIQYGDNSWYLQEEKRTGRICPDKRGKKLCRTV